MMKEEILQNFLSKEPQKILTSSREVIRSVIVDRDMIKSLAPYEKEIREATSGLSYGGAILPNQRFVDKALKIISECREEKCLCEYAFDDFGLRAKSMERYGFVFLSDKTEGYINTGEIECPNCHQRYLVEEEFTGWHITSTRHRKI